MLKKDRAVVLLHTPSRVLRDTQTKGGIRPFLPAYLKDTQIITYFFQIASILFIIFYK